MDTCTTYASRKPYRILLLGYFGQRNSGDDALMAAAMEHIVHPTRPVEWILPRANHLAWVPEGISHRVPSGSKWLNLLRADAVVYGGGSVMHDRGRHGCAVLSAKHRMVVAARLLHKPVLFLSVGVGPLKWPRSRRAVRAMIRCADLFCVRDGQSGELCREIEPGCKIVRVR